MTDMPKVIILKDNADCDSVCASLGYKLLYEQLYNKQIKIINHDNIPEIAQKIIKQVGLEFPDQTNKLQIAARNIPNTGRVTFKVDMPIRTAISQYYNNDQLDYIVTDENGQYKGVVQLQNLLKTFMFSTDKDILSSVDLEFDHFVQTIEGIIVQTKESDIETINDYESQKIMKNYKVFIPTNQLDCFKYMIQNYTEEQMKHSIAIVGHNVEIINHLIERKCGIIILTKSCINLSNTENKMRRISSNEHINFCCNVLIEDNLTNLYNNNQKLKDVLTQKNNESLIIQSKFSSNVIANLIKHCLSVGSVMDSSLKYVYDESQPISGLKFDENIYCRAIIDKNMKVLNHIERVDMIDLKLLSVTLIGHQSLQYVNRYIDESHIILETVLDRHLINQYAISGAQTIRIKSVGSVCTLVYFYFCTKTQISKQIAKLLLYGILLDTLNLKSEKTTQDDLTAVQQLIKIAEEDQQDVFNWLMQNSLNLSYENKMQLLMADYKIYNYKHQSIISEYSLSSIEVDSLDDLNQDSVQEILKALDEFEYKLNVDFCGLFITNATTNESVLILNDFQDLQKIQQKLQKYDKNIQNAFVLPGVTSRTKTVVPMLNKILEQ